MSRKPFLEMTFHGRRKRLIKATGSECLESPRKIAIEDTCGECSPSLSHECSSMGTIPDVCSVEGALKVASSTKDGSSEDDTVCGIHKSTSVNENNPLIILPENQMDDETWPKLNVEDELSSDSDSDRGCELSDNEILRENLRNWAVQFKVSLVSVSALLCILKTHKCFDLPCDARSLLKTPSSVSVQVMHPGHYSYFGLECSIRKVIDSLASCFSSISLLIGVDGCPLFKSGSSECWPILATIVNLPSVKSLVFPIGIYLGKGKPDCSEFLKDFVTEAVELLRNGMMVKGRKVKVFIKGFICDAPAKAFILGIKGHTGYSSCTKCKQEGVWIHHRMSFPLCDGIPRTNEGFLLQEDSEFHVTNTILTRIPDLHFIDNFPLDYMHLVCLGVMRTLIYIWVSGPVPLKFPHRVMNSISVHLLSLAGHVPCEFSRKPRGLDEIRKWKATEFRQFLLYTGPVVLFTELKLEYSSIYNNFLSLSVAMRILLSPKYCIEHQEYAKNLLFHFVKTCTKLYGPQYITHNFHGLTHIADDVEHFGALDNCSAFPFENFLQFLKKSLRKGDKPLQQLVKRVHELSASSYWLESVLKSGPKSCVPVFSMQHYSGPLLPGCDNNQQFYKATFPTFEIRCSPPNSCAVLSNGSIVVVKNIVFSIEEKCMVLICQEFLKKQSFYGEPLVDSALLGIFVVSELSNLKKHVVSDVAGKIVLLPLQGKNVAFPMLHHA